MAIKIAGTTVIDDSRQLQNLGAAITAAQGGTGLTSPGTSGNILTSDGTGWTSAAPSSGVSISATASGAITAGTPVIVNSAGTVSQVGGASESAGSDTLIYTSFDYSQIDTLIASPDGTRVVYFRASYTPTCYVGSVSGTAITWSSVQTATPTNVSNFSTGFYDTDSGKYIIVYKDGDYALKAIAGTLSGTTITWSSPTTLFTSGTIIESNVRINAAGTSGGIFAVSYTTNTSEVRVFIAKYSGGVFTAEAYGRQIGTGGSYPYGMCCFDPTTGNLLIGCNTNTNLLVTMCGVNTTTLETTSLAQITFSPTYSDGRMGGIQYAPAAGAFLITFSYSGNDLSYGTFTATSTTLTKVVDRTYVGGALNQSTTYGFSGRMTSADSSGARIMVAYGGSPSGNQYTFVRSFTVASGGSSVTVGSQVTVSSVNYSFAYGSSNIVLAGTAKAVLSYGDPSYGYTYSKVQQLAYSNLTADGYIGVAKTTVSDGATALVAPLGNVATGLSGLTPGAIYYVTTAGGFSTTAGSPSVLAGTALTSSTMLLKG